MRNAVVEHRNMLFNLMSLVLYYWTLFQVKSLKTMENECCMCCECRNAR